MTNWGVAVQSTIHAALCVATDFGTCCFCVYKWSATYQQLQVQQGLLLANAAMISSGPIYIYYTRYSVKKVRPIVSTCLWLSDNHNFKQAETCPNLFMRVLLNSIYTTFNIPVITIHDTYGNFSKLQSPPLI